MQFTTNLWLRVSDVFVRPQYSLWIFEATVSGQTNWRSYPWSWGTRAAPPAPRMVAAVYGCDGPVLTMHNHRKLLDEVVRLSGVGCQIDAERVGRQSRRGSYFAGIVGYVDGARRAHADLSLARCALKLHVALESLGIYIGNVHGNIAVALQHDGQRIVYLLHHGARVRSEPGIVGARGADESARRQRGVGARSVAVGIHRVNRLGALGVKRRWRGRRIRRDAQQVAGQVPFAGLR